MKELDYYFSAIFKQCNRMEYTRYTLLVFTISCLSFSIYAHGYHLYTAAIVALLFQIASWYLKTKIENVRYIANEFQKISMLCRAYGNVPSEFQLSHLKALVNKQVSSYVEQKKENDAEGAEYNLKSNDNPRKILMSMIQENSYFNHHLYKNIFVILTGWISVIAIGLIVVSLFAFPVINIDPEYSVPRLAFTFLSFSLVYEVLEKTIKSYNSSKIMLEIDNELTRTWQDISEEHLMKIFTQYFETKEAAPDVPFFVYNSNRGRLTKGWSSRIQKINKANA